MNGSARQCSHEENCPGVTVSLQEMINQLTVFLNRFFLYRLHSGGLVFPDTSLLEDSVLNVNSGLSLGIFFYLVENYFCFKKILD